MGRVDFVLEWMTTQGKLDATVTSEELRLALS